MSLELQLLPRCEIFLRTGGTPEHMLVVVHRISIQHHIFVGAKRLLYTPKQRRNGVRVLKTECKDNKARGIGKY